jgi:hypothetical protein
MAERSVTVRISATDNFSTVVDNYKRKMGEADAKTDQMGNKADTTGGKVDALGTALRGAMTLGVIVKAGQILGQMVAIGTEVQQTKERFEELVAPLGNAADVMDRLRVASLGIATDKDLQSGANLLMQMGIAESPEDLENIIGLITRLKKPSEDLGTAIDDFSKLLSNQSVLRLDNFGLSSARVRVRILELLESGQALNREEAFKMATLEEGALAIERLGSSAENASTPIARLTTNVENLFNEASAGVATSIQAGAGILEIGLGLHPEQLRQAEEQARITAENLNQVMTSAMEEGHFGAGFSSDFVHNYMSTAFDLAQSNPALASDAQTFMDAVFASMDQGLRNGPRGYLDLLAFSDDDPDGQQAIQAMTEMALQIDAATQSERELTVAREAAAMAAEDARIEQKARALMMEEETTATLRQLIAEEELLDKEQKINQQNKAERLAREAQEMENVTRATLRQFVAEENLTEALNRKAEKQLEIQAAQRSMAEEISGLERAAIDEGFSLFTGGASFEDMLPDFMTSEQAENIRAMADEAERLARELEDAAKETPDLISETELENARSTADAVGDMADEAERAAEAFANIKLSDIFGQTGGGTLGEISSLVLENFAGSDEQKAALERQLALTSGQETQGSLFLQEIIAPAIAEAGEDPELAAQMASKINEILLNAALAGVDTNSEDFLATLQEQIGDVGLLGLDTEALVEDFATMEGNLTAMGESATTLAEDTTTMSDSMSAASEPSAVVAENSAAAAASLEEAASAAQSIQKTMAALTSHVHKIKAQIDVTVTGDDFDGLIAKSVRNNGGKVPGALEN